MTRSELLRHSRLIFLQLVTAMDCKPTGMFLCTVSCFVALAIAGSGAAEDAWPAETVNDAVQAGPPEVTDSATILGWTPDGRLEVARYGAGPYTCIASGSFSLRIGKPALPYPDPMCMDQNAWSFLQAVWAGADDLPNAPGLVWMLAGMNVSKDAVDVGATAVDIVQDTSGSAEVLQMTPHVMIMPLPFAEASAEMATSYNLNDPLAPWIMASGQRHEHLMVHFRPEDVKAMRNASE